MPPDSATQAQAPANQPQQPHRPREEDFTRRDAFLFDQEANLLRQRREGAGFTPGSEIHNDLVGLALSGGGPRSASFNLGVLQAFYRRGLLRFVDYLTTVSGGGYIGAFLLSRVTTRNRMLPNVNHEVRTTPYWNNEFHEDLGIAGRPGDEKQPPDICRLVANGKYLDHVPMFFNHYVLGLFLNNLVIFSLLVGLATTIAYVWRLFDTFGARWFLMDFYESVGRLGQSLGLSENAVDFLKGLSDDFYVAFLPAFVALLLWGVVWLIGLLLGLSSHPSYRQRVAAVTKYLLIGSALFVLIGCAVILGNGNTGVGPLGKEFSVPGPILGVIGSALLTTLLPLVRPWLVIGSGHQPKNRLQAYIFRVASTGFLVGIPLGLVYWMARENISGYGDYCVTDIQDWNPFAKTILDEHKRVAASSLAVGGRERAGEMIWTQLRDYRVDTMKDVVELNTRRAKDAQLTTLQSLLLNDNTIEAALGILQDSRYPHVVKRRQLVINALNELMDNKELARAILEEPAETDRARVIAQAVSVHGLVSPTDPWLAVPQVAAAMEAGALDVSGLRAKPSQEFDQWFASMAPWWQPAPLRTWISTWIMNQPSPNDEYPLFNRTGFDKREFKKELRNLVGKFTYLSTHEKQSAEFEHEFRREGFIRKLNLYLLALCYPKHITPESSPVVERVVVIYRDQKARLTWLWQSFLIGLVSALFVSLNVTSLHRYYRNQLSEGYLQINGKQARELAVGRLSEATQRGWPYPILCASVGTYRPALEILKHNASEETADETAKELADGFYLSPLYCGSPSTGYQATTNYLLKGRPIRLNDAMALSGAAVTPLRVHNPLIKCLMYILNIRLGQWVPRPSSDPFSGHSNGLKYLVAGPSVFGITLRSLLQSFDRRPYCFVTDGGHYDNVGLWPLLMRRCYLIIVSDASQDKDRTFEDFLQVCRRARVEQGIEFLDLEGITHEANVPLRLDPIRLDADVPVGDSPLLKSLKERFSRQHYLMARIVYPEDGNRQKSEGRLIYMKASLTGDEANDLIGFCQGNPDFPHDPTLNPILDADQVESYRQLGQHIGEVVCRNMERSNPDWASNTETQTPLWDRGVVNIRKVVEYWEKAESQARAQKRPPFPGQDWVADLTSDPVQGTMLRLSQQQAKATSSFEKHADELMRLTRERNELLEAIHKQLGSRNGEDVDLDIVDSIVEAQRAVDEFRPPKK
jgi:hypothetical protein